MQSVEKLTVSSDLLVSFARLLGKALLLFNRVDWFVKFFLPVFALSSSHHNVIAYLLCICDAIKHHQIFKCYN